METEGDIKKLRQEVDFMEREVKGELGLKKRRKVSELNKKIQSEKKTIENCDWGAEATNACKKC